MVRVVGHRVTSSLGVLGWTVQSRGVFSFVMGLPPGGIPRGRVPPWGIAINAELGIPVGSVVAGTCVEAFGLVPTIVGMGLI